MLGDLSGADPEYQRRSTATKAVIAGLHELIRGWSAPPAKLAHYTSLAAGTQIVSGGALWLFNAYTMNDEFEIDHALDFIESQFEKRQKRLWDALKPHLKLRRSQQASVYVFCLSEGAGESATYDKLSMWRAYGDNGDGVALRFHTEALLNGENPSLSAQPTLARVIYDDAEKTEKVAEIANEYSRLCEANGLQDDDVAHALMAAFWQVAPIFKHQAFADEREWRIIVEPETSFAHLLQGIPDSTQIIEFVVVDRISRYRLARFSQRDCFR